MFKIKICFLMLMGFIFLGCTPSLRLYEFSGQTMGTTYSVKIYSDQRIAKKQLKKQIDDTLVEVNRQMSTYVKNSEISKVNQALANQPQKISSWFYKVLSYSLSLAQKTEGQFDPTIGPLVNLWGFGPKSKKKVPSLQKLKEVQSYVGFDKLMLETLGNKEYQVSKLKTKTYVDLSASAKGFGVDAVSELLSAQGLPNHLVEVGGEMRASGYKPKRKPWRVAIEKPQAGVGRAIQRVLKLQDRAIATSGSYRNFYESGGRKYSHTINQKTGRPVEHNLVSVSVLAQTCLEADALATALNVMGPEKAYKYAQDNNIAAYLIVALKNGTEVKVQSTDQFLKITGGEK